MEYIRILRTNLGTTWQNQSYMHVAMITFNPSHAWPFQKLRVSCKKLWQSILYTCVFLSLGSTWTCTCFSGKPTMQANMKLCKYCHIQAAIATQADSIHIHDLSSCSGNCTWHGFHWQYLCRVVSCICIRLFSCYAMQYFQQIWKEYGHSMEQILQSKSVSECADQAVWLA